MKEAAYSNLHFRSKMSKLDRFVASDWGNKSHYEYIKDFDRFMFHKTKHKNKNTFVKVDYSVLVANMCWQKIKKFVWVFIAHNLSDLKNE